MALKPTIYKLKIALSDLNRDYYDSFNLTVAQHPSENVERMMARVLAFCLNAGAELAFTRGLSSVEEPDIWLRTLDGKIALWIEVGEPTAERIKKASRQSDEVRVYSFNSKSDVWWEQNRARFENPKVSVFRFQWPQIEALAALVSRTFDLVVTVSGNSAFISAATGDVEIEWDTLQSAAV